MRKIAVAAVAAAVAVIAVIVAVPALAVSPTPAPPSVTRASIKITGARHFSSSSQLPQSFCGFHARHGALMIAFMYWPVGRSQSGLELGPFGKFLERDGKTDLDLKGSSQETLFVMAGHPSRAWQTVPRHGHAFLTLSDNRTSIGFKATMYPQNVKGHVVLTKKPIHVVASFNCLPVPVQ